MSDSSYYGDVYATPASPHAGDDVPVAVAIEVVDESFRESSVPHGLAFAAGIDVGADGAARATRRPSACRPLNGRVAKAWLFACGPGLGYPRMPRWNCTGLSVFGALAVAWLIYAVGLTYYTVNYIFADRDTVTPFCIDQAAMFDGKICLFTLAQVGSGVFVVAQMGVGLFFFGQLGIGLIGGAGMVVASVGVASHAMLCVSFYTHAAMVSFSMLLTRSALMTINVLRPLLIAGGAERKTVSVFHGMVDCQRFAFEKPPPPEQQTARPDV